MPPAQDSGTRAFRAPVLVLALLSLTAGFADGYALTRADVFVANQSGNIVRIGMGAVGEYPAWDLALLSMLGFAAGGMSSWLLARAAIRRHWNLPILRIIAVMGLVLAWWATAIGVDDRQEAGWLSAFLGATAMGVVATILTHVSGVQAQPAFQSANVLSSAQGLLSWATRSDPVQRTGRRLAAIGGMTLACYAVGGGMGAVAEGLSPSALLAVLGPMLVCLLLVSRPDE